MAAAAAPFLHFLFPKCAPLPALPIKSLISLSTPALSPNTHFSAARLSARRAQRLLQCAAVQDVPAAEQKEAGTAERVKLYVVNLPWGFTAAEIEKLFSESGTVKGVEIIKQKNGKSRGFAFVTMASAEEANAAVQKFDSYEVMGRIIRVEFAKSLRKPTPPPPPQSTAVVETQNKIYAANLAWKVRSSDLRSFFSAKFNPVSIRVVFDTPNGRSSGYGFVSFATKEEAEAAISELDGKELMGRPLRLRISKKKGSEAGREPGETDNAEVQPEES